MNIRNITPEDLPTLSKLTEDESLKSRTDICYEHSKLCLDDNGQIVAAAILRENCIKNHFGGKISLINDSYLKRAVRAFKSRQYEIIGIYNIIQEEFSRFLADSIFIDGHNPIGIVWLEKSRIQCDWTKFYFNEINDEILVTIPYIE